MIIEIPNCCFKKNRLRATGIVCCKIEMDSKKKVETSKIKVFMGLIVVYVVILTYSVR